jgi:hypothetical protein
MRDFTITDLHDYYDFTFAVEGRADAIIERVLSGQYRAEPPLIYRVEKKLGVCRHLMVPTPSDAVVFQLLTDGLYPEIIAGQPSKAAFYSRDHSNLSLPHEHREAATYPWFILWPKFQEEIWKFSRAHKYLVTTDLTNYYDSIGLRELRHVISSIAKADEVYLDLLFSLIEDLSWTPDYLPRSNKGLPTINIEAVRLLAHALLFEVDYVLIDRTGGNFVRWMDDINFGVKNVRAASVILGEVNDVLKSRGLALNLGKTEVMTAREAEYHFMFRENVRLTKVLQRAKKLKTVAAKRRLGKRTQRELEQHLAGCNARNKDKVTKRFFTIFRALNLPLALPQAKAVYAASPSLRNTVLNYLCGLPFSARVATTFLELFGKIDLFDDASRFAFVSSIVEWRVPRSVAGQKFIQTLKSLLAKPQTAFDWLCHIVLLAKYGEAHEVLTQARNGRRYRDAFFARQRVAALPRGLGINPSTVLSQWRTESTTGYSDSASVTNNLLRLCKTPFPSRKMRLYGYLFPSIRHRRYPLAKFLLLCCLAFYDRRANKQVVRPEIRAHVDDAWYLYWLRLIQPAWF